MALKPGDEVDRYRIVALLGAGGMGEVYQAFDMRLQRHVALKLLHPEKEAKDGSPPPPGSSSSGTALLLREARAAAQLEHPNVVNVHDVGELKEPQELAGTAYLAMELIKGRSLRQAVSEGHPLAERLRWLTDVARALAAAHALGLVHRDIKPENVMLRNDGVIKVLDFGLAKRSRGHIDPTLLTNEAVVNTLTTKGVAIGTPYYMAPEQMRADPLDGRADQFSWGVMAYELLAGQGPWRVDSDALALITQVLSGSIALPSDRNPEIPSHVTRVILRALSRDREQRFPSMNALVDAFTNDTEVEAATVPPPAQLARRGDTPGPLPNLPAELAQAKTEVAAARVASAAPVTESTAKGGQPNGPLPSARPGSRWRAIVVLAAIAAASTIGMTMRRGARPAPATPDAAVTVARCSSHTECVRANAGKAFRCRPRDGACVAMATEECQVRAEPGDLENEGTFWIGTLFAADGNDDAIELARRDFAQAPAKLAGGRVRHPVAAVTCDDRSDPVRAARHLVDDVGVSAVIGFSASQEAIDVASSTLVPGGVFTAVALNTASQITSIRSPEGKPRLVWRTTNSTTQMAFAVSAFVSEALEPRLSRERHRPLRVALLRASTAGGLGFSDAIISSLRYNGAGVADNGSSFAEHVLDYKIPPDDPRAEEAVRDTLNLRPDIVVYYGSELVTQVIRPVEAKWPAREPRPFYVSALPFTPDVLRGDTTVHRRLFGITTPANTPVNAKFTHHYNATFPQKISAAFSPNTTYDAFYLLAYASYALGETPVSGDALSGAVKRLIGPGPKIEVGPWPILEALGALSAGETIDLQGAGSDLDFDLATGESPTDHVMLCVGHGADGAAVGVESGLVWDAKTNKLRGTLKCP